jgi:DNA (cytosine-5)-methyltransferase 1
METRFVDLFAGIGGFRLVADSLWGTCVFTSEWDSFARSTYSANFPGSVIGGDITKILGVNIPQFDILMAGLPCQAFSKAGRHEGFGDDRGGMFFEVARIVEYHKPAVVLLENVPSLVTHDAGRTLKVIARTLNKLGYETHHQILNAKDFGLPQNRRRIYIVGLRNANGEIDPNNRFSFPIPPKTPTRVGDIFESEVDSKYTITDRLWEWLQERKRRNRQAGKGFGYSLVTASSVHTNTISARYHKDGAEILIEQSGRNPRMLTPREAARLQGFPDTFYIPTSNARAYQGFGNSIAVPVIRALAQEIDRYLKRKSSQRIGLR